MLARLLERLPTIQREVITDLYVAVDMESPFEVASFLSGSIIRHSTFSELLPGVWRLTFARVCLQEPLGWDAMTDVYGKQYRMMVENFKWLEKWMASGEGRHVKPAWTRATLRETVMRQQ